MKDQVFFSPSRPLEDEVGEQKQGGVLQSIAQAWLRFSGPDKRHFNSALASQERLRRSRILSALFVLIIVAVVIIAPTAIPTPIYWIPLSSFVLFGLIAFVLNRFAFITASSIVYIFGIDTTLAILMLILPNGIRNTNIPDFDLFLIATLIGGIVLPSRLLPFLTGFHIALIVVLFTFLPHEHLLTLEIQTSNQGFYGEISDAILLQVVGMTIAWLNAWSVNRALVRVSKAEDLAKAHSRLSEYIRAQVRQRESLEHGIQILQEAHARFANGDYKARVHLQDNELVALALSFNLLAERLNRIAQIAQEHARLEQAFQQLFAIRDKIVHLGVLQPFIPTGTYVDQLYPWLKQFYHLRQFSSRCNETVEKARQTLTRQRTLVTQLMSMIDQTHSEVQMILRGANALPSTLVGVEKSQQVCRQVDEQGKRCLQEARLLEQLLKLST